MSDEPTPPPKIVAPVEDADFSAPPEPPAPASFVPRTPDLGDHLVPTANKSALLAYYLGIFSLIPCLGLFLGPAAIIKGSQGLTWAETLPSRLGRGHAMTGVVIGWIVTVAHIALIVVIALDVKR